MWEANIRTGTPADGCGDPIATGETLQELCDNLKEYADEVAKDFDKWDRDYLVITRE